MWFASSVALLRPSGKGATSVRLAQGCEQSGSARMASHSCCGTQTALSFLVPPALLPPPRRWTISGRQRHAQPAMQAHQARSRFSADIQRAAALRKAGELGKARDVLRKASADTRRLAAYHQELLRLTAALVAQTSSASEAERLWRALEPRLLHTGSRPDAVAFNTLLSALRLLDSRRPPAKRHDADALRILRVAHRVFHIMVETAVRPDQYTMSILFNMCAYRASGRFAALFEQQAVERFNFKPNMVSGSALLAAFAKADSLQQVERVFNLMQQEHVALNERSYTSIISAHFKHGKHAKVLSYCDQAIASTAVTPNVFLFSGALASCLRACDAENGLRIFQTMQERQVRPTEPILNLMLELGVRTGDYGIGLKYITEWASKHGAACDALVCNKIIASWKKTQHNAPGAINAVHQVLQYLENSSAIKLDSSTYNAALTTLVALGTIDRVGEFLRRMRGRGIVPDLVTYNILIHSYGTAGDFDRALGVIHIMKQNHVHPDVITYNTLLNLLLNYGEADKAETLLQDMENNEHVEMDAVSRCMQLKLYRIQGNKQAALQLCNTTQLLNGALDAKAHGLLLSILFEFDEGKKAISLFGWLVWKRLAACAAYNVLIDNIGKREDGCEQCAKLFSHMKRKGIPPDKVTYSTMIRVFSKSGRLRLAFRLLSEMQDIGLAMSDMHAWTALMDGCRRYGQWQRAVELLAFMKKHSSQSKHSLVPSPSTACYNAALYAAGIDGQDWPSCVKIYESLLADKTRRPDHVTYSAMASIILKKRGRISEWHIVTQVCQALEHLLLDDGELLKGSAQELRWPKRMHQGLNRPMRKKLLSKLSDLKALKGPEIQR